MIALKDISANLNRLDNLYTHCSSNREKTFYSKLAIIELCGWLEQTMDRIVDAFVIKRLKYKEYRKIYKEKKKKNHGFQYEEHFRKMLYETIGIHNLQSLEAKFSDAEIASLEATLNYLNTKRNQAAHTRTTDGSVYDSPSVIKSKFTQIEVILIKFHEKISAIPL